MFLRYIISVYFYNSKSTKLSNNLHATDQWLNLTLIFNQETQCDNTSLPELICVSHTEETINQPKPNCRLLD